MKKSLSNERGNSMVELIMVMMLLILFGVTIYSLIFAGAQTQNNINVSKDAQIDARIAISYLNKWIRQNDVDGTIRIEKNPETGKNALVITDMSYPDSELTTWIYEYDGYLCEYLPLYDDEPNFDYGTHIAPILDYNISYDEDKNILTQSIDYDYNGKIMTLSSTLHLHSKINVVTDTILN